MTTYYMDLYKSPTSLLVRLRLAGEPGKFTSTTIEALVSNGVCVKVGVWSGYSAEVFNDAPDNPFLGKIDISSLSVGSVVAKGADSLVLIWINKMTKPASLKVDRSRGCKCGTWLGGGIHADYCATALVGTYSPPYEGDIMLEMSD